MLDLDSLESLQINSGPSTLYIQFAHWLCLKKISYVEFQKLSKWFNVYEYVLPMDREVDHCLCDRLYTLWRNDLFYLALLISHIEANLRPEHQIILLSLINDGELVEKK